jgi:hypothetical protein
LLPGELQRVIERALEVLFDLPSICPRSIRRRRKSAGRNSLDLAKPPTRRKSGERAVRIVDQFLDRLRYLAIVPPLAPCVDQRAAVEHEPKRVGLQPTGVEDDRRRDPRDALLCSARARGWRSVTSGRCSGPSTTGIQCG